MNLYSQDELLSTLRLLQYHIPESADKDHLKRLDEIRQIIMDSRPVTDQDRRSGFGKILVRTRCPRQLDCEYGYFEGCGARCF